MMSSKHTVRCLAVAAAFGLCAARGASAEQAMPAMEIDEGVSWDLAEHRAATLSDPRYRYHLRIPRDRSAPVSGTVEIRFAWSDPEGRDLVVDFMDPSRRVAAVRANGAAVDWVPRHDHVVVPAAALRPDAGNRVELDFEAGDEALNRNDDFLYTLFVPDRAHFSLPLFDQPNLKARFELSLEAPAGWVAVANGETVEAPDGAGGDGPVSWRFAETEPIPTYLFAFAAGRFQVETAERAGRRLRMFHRETDAAKVARNRDAIFDLHAAALDWLEDYTGIPYPFGKFDFVLVPPFQYGGMEHPGSIFYRASSLMLDESATQAAYLGRASLIAHETAHMWFGDLVTMNWFDDVWTKEVFANFLAAKIVHPSFPEVDHDLRFFLAHHEAAYGIDRTAGANPIRQPLENLKEAGALYGPIIYQKAPIVMRHLERLVGEERFRDGLREYLRTFAYGNATWPDLIDILDRRTGTDLRSWSAVWVDEPGRPTVTVGRGRRGRRRRRPDHPRAVGSGRPVAPVAAAARAAAGLRRRGGPGAGAARRRRGVGRSGSARAALRAAERQRGGVRPLPARRGQRRVPDDGGPGHRRSPDPRHRLGHALGRGAGRGGPRRGLVRAAAARPRVGAGRAERPAAARLPLDDVLVAHGRRVAPGRGPAGRGGAVGRGVGQPRVHPQGRLLPRLARPGPDRRRGWRGCGASGRRTRRCRA